MSHLHVIAVEILRILGYALGASLLAGISGEHDGLGVVLETDDDGLLVHDACPFACCCEFRIGDAQHLDEDAVHIVTGAEAGRAG